MISFPFSFVLIPYALVVLFFIVMAIINVHVLVYYGATTKMSFIVTFLFLAGGTLILFATWHALQGTDWTQQISFAIPTIGVPVPSTGP